MTINKKAWGAGTAIGLVLAVGSAAAQDQTEAGTKVGNTFTLDYAVGGTPQTTITNATGNDADNDGVDDGATSFVVDRRIDVNVTNTGGGGNVGNGGSGGTVSFAVKNEGNDNQRYDLSVATAGDATIDGTNRKIFFYVDGSGNPVTDPNAAGAVKTEFTGSNYPALAPGQTILVVVEGDTVSGANAQTGTLSLVATTRTPVTYADGSTPASQGVEQADSNNANDINAVENVFADASGAAGDAAENGAHAASATYTVAAAALTGTKDVFVLNQDGTACPAATPTQPTASVAGAYAVPGACVAYVIDVSNSGGATATDIDVSDSLPEGITFMDAAMFGQFAAAGNGAALTEPSASCAAGGGTTCEVRVDDGVLAASENGSLVIWAKISGTVN